MVAVATPASQRNFVLLRNAKMPDKTAITIIEIPAYNITFGGMSGMFTGIGSKKFKDLLGAVIIGRKHPVIRKVEPKKEKIFFTLVCC